MKSLLFVQNLRCNGCARSIRNALEEIAGIKNIVITPDENKVVFDSKDDIAQLNVIRSLRKIGYPTSDGNNTMSNRATSLISCIKGKIENKIK